MADAGRTAKVAAGDRNHERPIQARVATPGEPVGLVSPELGSVLLAQRLVGNRATVQLLRGAVGVSGRSLTVARQRRGRARTVTFTEEEGTHLTGGQSTVDARLDRIHNRNAESLRLLYMNSQTGLDQFRDTMAFSSEQEAEPQIAEAIGKAYFKFLIDTLVGLIPEEATKTVVKGAIALGTAVWEEEQRAAAAAGDRRILAFITRTRSDLARAETTTLANFRNEQLRAFLASYPGDRSARVLETSQEAWIAAQQRAADVLRRAIPDNRAIQQQLTERFADTGGFVGLVTQGTWRTSGTLSIGLHASGSPEAGWRVTEIDRKWILHTRAPRPERVAQNLEDSLEGYSAMFSTLPKEVQITASTGDDEVSAKMIVQGAIERGPRIWFQFGPWERDASLRQRREEVMNSIGRSGAVAQSLLAVANIDGSNE